ncbi:hypothetical protein AKO1_008221 [Acrasis kona]|uniref:Nudix hydrolase domain-containing protein n=1 Tax=Acrasis kona TaxID=1008807 RepID=A0AAW2YNU9_9EUKA
MRTRWPLFRQLIRSIDQTTDANSYIENLKVFSNLINNTNFADAMNTTIPCHLKYVNKHTNESLVSTYKMNFRPLATSKKRSAVTVLFLTHHSQIHVLVMKKSPINVNMDRKYRHGGQYAFPGGMQDEGESILECALRELQEEVGISETMIKVCNDTIPESTTAVGQTPVKAFLAVPTINNKILEYKIQEQEVDQIYEIPLLKLIDSYEPLQSTFISSSNKRYLQEMNLLNKKVSDAEDIEEYFVGPVFKVSDVEATLKSEAADVTVGPLNEMWGFSSRLFVMILNGFEEELEQNGECYDVKSKL